jgi:MOSC domain-containing protein|tara:strand:+ start:923 stop:1792 length:870 start_codon:yes stop_codon:yes gene_type:complete
MIKVGTVQQIWRYPVKGMAGENLNYCHLGDMGLQGDRIWALRDVERQEIQSCKFRPQLLRCVARCRSTQMTGAHDQVDIHFPDGRVIGSDDTQIHSLLSELTGHESTLESLRPLAELDFYRRHKKDDHTWLQELKDTFDREADEPLPEILDDLPSAAKDFVSLPGTFFLVTPFHLLTTATLAHMQKLNPEADWDVQRFRPNLVIETLPGMEGLVEQAWVDNKLQIGRATIECSSSTPRCGAVTRTQQSLKSDSSILRTIVKQADQNLGIYGAIKQSAVIRLGDEVFLQT